VRELLLSLDQNPRGREQDLGASRRRNEAPRLESTCRRVDGGCRIRRSRFLELPDDLAVIRRIAVLEQPPGSRRHPLATDVVVEDLWSG
jgi:hypothetical protein